MAELRQDVDAGEAGLDPKALDRLDQHFARLVDEGRLPGHLVCVARGGRVAHLTAYGHRDRAAGLPVGTGPCSTDPGQGPHHPVHAVGPPGGAHRRRRRPAHAVTHITTRDGTRRRARANSR